MSHLLSSSKNKLVQVWVHIPTACEGDFSSRFKRKCDGTLTAYHDINFVFAKVYRDSLFSLFAACAVGKCQINFLFQLATFAPGRDCGGMNHADRRIRGRS